MLDNRSCPLCPLVKTRVSSKRCVGISPSSFRASAGLYSHCDPRPLSPVPAAIHAAFRRDLAAAEAPCEKTAGSQSYQGRPETGRGRAVRAERREEEEEQEIHKERGGGMEETRTVQTSIGILSDRYARVV